MLRIVIVDDEQTVIHGLKHMFAKHCSAYEIAGTASSAREALQLLEHVKTDVVITDIMMPEMNGIELTREICRLYPSISVVILSGHSEFEFVRQAMRDGAIDYLLKPCHYQMILETMQKIERRVAEKDREHEKLSYNHFLVNLLEGKLEAHDDWRAQSGSELAMAVISGKGHQQPHEGDGEQAQQRQASAWNAADLGLSDAEADTVVHEGKWVMILRDADDNALSRFKQKLYDSRQRLRRQNRLIYAVVHRFPRSPQCIAQAYKTCNRMLEMLEFHEQLAVLDDNTYKKELELSKDFSIGEYLCGKELGRYYACGERKKLQAYIESGLNRLIRISVKPEPVRLKRELLYELVYMEQLLKEQGCEAPFGGQTDYMQELKAIRSYHELLQWLKSLLLSLLMCMNDENLNPQYIQSAIRYLEMNYMEDLTLKAVAEAVYLNPWYFSTQFKKHTGMAFSEYLNTLRVRMAKDFLRQKDLKVYQVAEMVGFQDATYFSTVFKNIEKMSPKEYQKRFQIS
jgi:two-component system, response regulator YesN